MPDLLDEVRWELEFELKMQVPAGEKLAGMVHHKIHDKAWTALGLAPHEDPIERFLYPPSTAATLNLAANAAQAARIWRGLDKAFAERVPRGGGARLGGGAGQSRPSTPSRAAWAAARTTTRTSPTNSTGRRPSCS